MDNSRLSGIILDKLRMLYPEAKCELEYKTPFQLLVAAILSAQSTDKIVNTVTKDLFVDYPDGDSFLKLSYEELCSKIRKIGLYKNKAKNILETCKILKQKYNGIIPDDIDELTKLPGVGRKTANVVASNIYGIPAIAVDTHVFRVSKRIGLSDANTPEKVEQQLMSVIDKDRWIEAHNLMIWHGRRVCFAKKPECSKCSITEYCIFYRNTILQS